ncbi:MAG: hypothetical protein QXX55_01270 [Candidatus Pacearchaeota archaeon]
MFLEKSLIEESTFIFKTENYEKIMHDLMILKEEYPSNLRFFNFDLWHFYDRNKKAVIQFSTNKKIMNGVPNIVVVSKISENLEKIENFIMDSLYVVPYSWRNFSKFIIFPDKRSRCEYHKAIDDS